ncbi:transcriptional regulator with XRE-family HTH domain [Antricoccus suffuscus]|uniref:Transcriptional regulator with XRE-family HTH domain n=1 Tax=Antricoccus suffuscus TaxID=1629062 RepID=A0A2T1A0H3_9ACTN|nr:helix-turn-helix transcriptional regulator [Antricoccus suffuscus]PRZ41987.1 transcriptional regulator with XRE-family HTH domain [Antricoccus suffuscus]
MTTDLLDGPKPVGALIKEWRQRRRISQLDLSIESGISTRHLSFVETGRSKPSSEMILKLSEFLGVPLRDRNHLLLAGGYAPAYAEHALDAPEMAAARGAVREVLQAHEPYPALAVDRMWNVVDVNASVDLLTRVASPHLLEGQINALRLTLHPDGLAPHIVNHGQWRAHVLGGLRRSAEARADLEMLALYDELRDYPCDDPCDGPGVPGGIHVPFILRVDDRQLSFLAIIATFGTAVDITLSELAIESFFPADEDTAAYLRR